MFAEYFYKSCNQYALQEPPAKRTRIEADSKPVSSSNACAPAASSAGSDVLDLATALKLKKGCRLEVLWTVEESDENTASAAETAIWWGCSYIGVKAGVHKVILNVTDRC